FSLGNRLADFRNPLVTPERSDFWQLDLVRCLDPLQFHGGHGARECACGVVARSTVAASSALRFSGTHNSVPGLHYRFRPPLARRMDAPGFSNALELPIDPPGVAFYSLIFAPVAPSDVNGTNSA